MATVKVNWSGGKDSTCAVMEHILRGDLVKAVCYVPMFTEDIPLLTKKHYDFILETGDWFKLLGAEVYIVTGISYYNQVLRRSTRGKYKGRVFGFPSFKRGRCHFKRDSKIKALRAVDVGFYDYEDIGIAADEVDRHGQLTDKLKSILCELNITEADAAQKCIYWRVYSPQYERRNRDGCVLCPFASEEERQQWFRDYPNCMPILIELQNFIRHERPDTTPLRGYKWFIS